MTMLASILILVIGYLLSGYMKMKKELENYKTNAIKAITSSVDMKETLRIGLYHRFKKKDQSNDNKNGNENYEMNKPETTTEGPLDFEKFVARIMSSNRNSSAHVTRASGDFGIDIEEELTNGKYLGQVKCYELSNHVSYEPIAIVHSQMIKQNAIGGYVVTTSDFTENARKYAKDINIDLIDGKELVELWLKQLSPQKETVENGKLVME